MEVINGNNLPILNWAKDLEESAMQQAINLANHPCTVGRVCIAPDGHMGHGMPIGGIIAVENAVIPNAVGVDIGCSMSAGKTNIPVSEVTTELLKKVIGGSSEYPGGIRGQIPVGQKHHKKAITHPIFDNVDRWNSTNVCAQEFQSAQHQIGTMGGGNHFIEIQAGDDGYMWYMVHSGSRNLGYKVGNYYNDLAIDLCTKFRQDKAVKDQLAFLPRGTKEYEDYLAEMNLCLEFAKANHDVMCNVIEKVLEKFFSGIKFEEHYYTRHNYAALENHDSRNLMIHRKGAIRARENDIAIIPGSQGTASYIVKGLGNPRSFCSASHGSGRVLSRTKAREQLSLTSELERMGNIVHNMTTLNQLDEAPSAYKDIDEVINLEADLVTPIVRLTPLAVVKE